jgi:hypothetical protein
MQPACEKQDEISRRRSNVPIMLCRLVKRIKDFSYTRILIYT